MSHLQGNLTWSGNSRPSQRTGRSSVNGLAPWGPPSCLHGAASPTGVPGGGDFSPVHLEQPVPREEGFGRPDSVDSVRTGNDVLSLARRCE